MKEYDFLIVGAGLYGCVFAHAATKAGKKCLVIDKRKHAGGNVYCRDENGINVHQYGAHIFHTNDENTWNFVNSFVEFNRYTNSPIANYKGKLYNLPFNMNTFYQLWGISDPQLVKEKLDAQIKASGIDVPTNLEEQAIKLVGNDMYEIFIKGYTEKQWGKPCNELPPFIIKRLPVRLTFDNNYFNDKFQGIPIGGYNVLIDGLLKDIPVKLETDFFNDITYFKSIAKKIVYTGPIDAFFDYKFGALEYRSLRFEEKILEIDNFQGNAVVNYTENKVPYTRIIEHKHFEFGFQKHTVVTYEYPLAWQKGMEPFYPVNDVVNNTLLKKYEALKELEENIIFGGRLAEYKYYDMHQIVAAARVQSKIVLAKD